MSGRIYLGRFVSGSYCYSVKETASGLVWKKEIEEKADVKLCYIIKEQGFLLCPRATRGKGSIRDPRKYEGSEKM